MSIAIIGTGNMAKGLAGLFAAAGFDVVLGARDAAKGKEVANAIGAKVSVSDVASAAAGSDVVVLAVPYDAAAAALSSAGDLAGKIVIDITNPLTPDYAGLTIGHETSAAEEIQKLVPEAHVVKAFNTLFAQVLQGGGTVAGTGATVFIAGDSEGATDKVAEIAEKAGLEPLKTGGLKLARYIEPVAGLNIALGYGRGHGTAIAPTWAGLV
ncbi:MAG TPA: NAD(P)-binding domain-containing protein [Ancylobacter sp.]